ncbi:hypothetical protein E2C01_048846 [Portunus trituberculatus]|uniref:Uncharacterized protein n=1 Tax=Portunus trituberculatus TaxID=210409 RepID=A0A5B7GC99_PORTR|nr:hypothetical protein [Portunus trituberculatus]
METVQVKITTIDHLPGVASLQPNTIVWRKRVTSQFNKDHSGAELKHQYMKSSTVTQIKVSSTIKTLRTKLCWELSSSSQSNVESEPFSASS